MEIVIKDWEDFAKWIHLKAKHAEELEQDNSDLQKENMQLRSELNILKEDFEALKNATATNSDESIFNTDSIPRIFRKVDKDGN